jgi:hypothetical protein
MVSIDDDYMYTDGDNGLDDTDVDTRYGSLSQAVAMVSTQKQEEEDQIQGMQEVFMAITIIAVILIDTNDHLWCEDVEGRMDITTWIRELRNDVNGNHVDRPKQV